jgi:uncharacterized protein YkwD
MLRRVSHHALGCLFSLGLGLVVLFGAAPTRVESAPNTAPGANAVISMTVPLIAPKSPSRTSSSTPAATFRVFLPLVTNGASAHSVAEPAWLAYLNTYRRASGLSPVTEDKSWSDACQKHARYLVNNNTVSHTENSTLPWYTPEGDAAGRASNVIGSSVMLSDEQVLIDSWMGATFHAVGMLDPRWSKTGFGMYQDVNQTIKTAACLDILRGMAEARTDAAVMFPGKNSTTTNLTHQYEWPDPASSCAGYTYPMGAPIILRLGSDANATNVTQTSLTVKGQAVEHCQLHAANYTNSDAYAQSVARNVLNNGNAIVLLPRAPLNAESAYAVTITVSSKVYAWTFNTGTASY